MQVGIAHELNIFLQAHFKQAFKIGPTFNKINDRQLPKTLDKKGFSMKKTHRLFWFGALAAGFIVVTVGIVDLKHPKVLEDQCQLVGQGPQVNQLGKKATWLYGQNGKPENNLGFSCKAKGLVLLNDDLILPAKNGQAFIMVEKTYQYLPKRYHLYLPVENPDKLETAANQLGGKA